MFCPNCGTAVGEQEKFCTACGHPVVSVAAQPTGEQPVPAVNAQPLLQTLSQRLNTNGIIWLVIGILQILGGLLIDWFVLVVGVLNVISAVQDMRYSKQVLVAPTGIVKKFEPLVGPIITLIYNLVIGGVIGVAGSIYYFVAIRSYVMENRAVFEALDAPAVQPPEQPMA